MTFSKTDGDLMSLALEVARGAFEADEVPVGAVLVNAAGRVIATEQNRVERERDQTAHAEMRCLSGGFEACKEKYLTHCTLYCTLEPCAMCLGAMILARIKRLVYGASEPKTGAVTSKLRLNEAGLNHKIEIQGGLFEAESGRLLKAFFQKKRRDDRVA